MTAPPGGGRRSEWLTDLEELADLAAETVAPQEVDEARRRRSAYSGERLASLLTVVPAEEEAATPPRPEETVVPRARQSATPPPAPARAAVPAWTPTPPAAAVSLRQVRQAVVGPPPRPAATSHQAPARRLLAPGLALLGTASLCAGLLLRLPGPDPAAPLSRGPAYSTPTPTTGGTSLQPAPAEPAAPAPLLSPAPPADGPGVPPGATAPLPPAPATGAGAPAGGPAVTGRTTTRPPVRPPAGAAPIAVPAVTASAAPSPTPVPATPPPSTSGAAVAVRSATLSMGACEDRGAAWVCPETATFVLSPGEHGTLSFHIVGTAVTCSGASTAFDRAQPDVDVPAGTTQVTVSSALVLPAGAPPTAAGPGGAASTARVEVTAPNPVSSAPVTFGAASCH